MMLVDGNISKAEETQWMICNRDILYTPMKYVTNELNKSFLIQHGTILLFFYEFALTIRPGEK